MNRKQKAMEERYRPRSEYNINTPKPCWPEITVERVLFLIQNNDPAPWDDIFDRKYCDRNFKNGGKTWDKAMDYLNSPLYKALS